MFLLKSKSFSIKLKDSKCPKSKSDLPIALDRGYVGSHLDRSRSQNSVLESWRALGSPQLSGPSFPAYDSPPTVNRQVHWQPANSTAAGEFHPRPAGDL